MDIILVILISLITIPIAEFTQGAPRIIFGVIVLLFFPGYTLTAALFPGKGSLKGIERAGLTLVLSFSLVSLTGLALNYTPWGIQLNPIIIAVTTLIILLSAITFWRRLKLSEPERFGLRFGFPRLERSTVSPVDKALYIALIVVVIGSLSTLAYVIERPKPEETFTNFYMLGPNGLMENYPSAISLNELANITLGIENHENKDTNYIVKVLLDGIEVQDIGPLSLVDESKWSNPITLKPSRKGENQKVEFLLYKNQEVEPYLNLRLWLDVK